MQNSTEILKMQPVLSYIHVFFTTPVSTLKIDSISLLHVTKKDACVSYSGNSVR